MAASCLSAQQLMTSAGARKLMPDAAGLGQMLLSQ